MSGAEPNADNTEENDHIDTQFSLERHKSIHGFKVERYKYILNELHSLNDNVHKYLTLFQTLATAIVAAGGAVFVAWPKLEIKPEMARLTIEALLGLLIILAVFVILSVMAGVLSWLDYRREEARLLDEVVEKGFRSVPDVRNFLRWYETYVVLLMVVIVVVAYFFVQCLVIPAIK
jgi:hypothetical protein